MTTIQKAKNVVRGDARNRLFQLTEDARSRIAKRGSELYDDAQFQSERALRSTRAWITKNPGATVGYAFLAGAVATMLVRRRRSVVND